MTLVEQNYEITVEASDADGNAHSMNVSIEITDATPPEITGPNGGAGAATSTIYLLMR